MASYGKCQLKEKYAKDKEAWENQKATERKCAEDAWKGALQ